MQKQKTVLPEIWGGIECTINRVGNRFRDQLQLTGFYENPAYLDSVISLGITHLRFPILWEKHQPSLNNPIQWRWAQGCLNKIRSHHIVPIAGLLHHGSGPRYTNLNDDGFPELFANYAAKLAAKFSWLEYYTPVNEPLTTARFSGLYGLWYPHKKNDVSFINILLNQLKATVLAMQKIREINPAAKLIQTEDLGKTYSAATLSYQADFENHRRWLTFDILCGRFDQSHPLWDYVMRLGIDVKKLQFFLDHPCPPAMIGSNYYVTSERFLDEDVEQYPVETIGGNGLHRYADVEAVRAHVEEPHGLGHLLEEIWDRFQIPIAITEAHINCTREEQLKWLHQVYRIAVKARNRGVDLRAVTSWAVLGAVGWNSLLTAEHGEYETGAFDTSAGYARPTAVSSLIKSIIKKENVKNLVSMPAWWQLDSRYYKKERTVATVATTSSVQPVVIIGTGTLGNALAKICEERNIRYFLLGRSEADICDEEKLASMIERYHPWAIINSAGYVNVDQAESDKQVCYRENFLGVRTLAAACSLHAVKLMSFSSDLVFDGQKNAPYIETDLANPLNTYGQSKMMAENFLVKELPAALLIRTAAFFGPWDHHNFVYELVRQLNNNNRFIADNDLLISPTYLPHLVHASLDLLIDDASGIWHLTNVGCLSWYEFAKKIVERSGLDARLLTPAVNLQRPAKRPFFSALASIKYNLMPSLDVALDAYFSSMRSATNFLYTKKMTNERI